MRYLIRNLFLSFFLCFSCVLSAADKTLLRVQLQWFDQSQFAGFYVAETRKHFEREGLQVEILPKSSDVDPISVLQSGEVDIAVSNLSNAWGSMRSVSTVTNIAQLFERSGLQVICRISRGVIRPEDMVGKKIGFWGIGDDRMVVSMLNVMGFGAADVEFVRQRPDGKDLVDGQVDCATAMSYNESISILNGGVAAEDLLVLEPEDFGLANIEDGLYVRSDRLRDPNFRQTLVKFVRALQKGWEDTRLAPTLAIDSVLRVNPALDRNFQYQMLEAILSLIPSEQSKFGVLDLEQLDRQATQIQSHTEKLHWKDLIWTYEVIDSLKMSQGNGHIYSPSTMYYVNQFVSHFWFKVLVFFGTFVFALNALLDAINRGYDLWGRVVLAMLGGVGGGTLRDIIIGLERQPFFYVSDVRYPLGILIVVCIVSLAVWMKPNLPGTRGFKLLRNYSDMIGFSFLAITGAVIAINANMPLYWAPICAALSCAGGGMLKDIVINKEPVTFRGAINEEVAVVGALILVGGLYISNEYEHSPEPVWLSVGGCIGLVFAIKWLIHTYGWRYPARLTTVKGD